jgi:hypothetical protein
MPVVLDDPVGDARLTTMAAVTSQVMFNRRTMQKIRAQEQGHSYAEKMLIDRGALYREYLRDITTADLTGPGRERGTNAVGEKDEESPGEASGRPPSGPELLEAEGKDASRGNKFRKEIDKDIGDVIDLENTGLETVKDLMARPSPTGHPEVPVNSGPVFGPDTPQHAFSWRSALTR